MGLFDFLSDIFYSPGVQNILSIGESVQMFHDEVVHGTEWKLDSINEEAEDLYKKTKSLIKTTKGNFTKALNAINMQRAEVYETTLKEFAKYFSKLKKVEFTDIKISSSKIDFNREKIELNTVTHQAGLTDLLVEGPVFGAGAWIIREFRLMDEVDDAKEELGRLVEECAVIRRKCAKVKSATRFLKTTHKTISVMKEFGDEFNWMLKNIIRKNGVNYKEYDDQTKQQIRAIYNINMALNYFVIESVVTSAGNIRTKYKKYISGISINKDETEKYLANEHFYLEDIK